MGDPEDHEGDFYEDEDSSEDDLLQECGLMHDGQCSQAGTEHCDFICPMRQSDQFCGSKAWHGKQRRSGGNKS